MEYPSNTLQKPLFNTVKATKPTSTCTKINASSVIVLIPEQFTVKAQQPLLGVKKRRGRRRRRRSKNLFVGKSYELSRTVFTSEIGQYIFFAGILGARSQFFKGLFRTFFIFAEKSRELPRTVFKSEIGQKNLFFWGGLFGLLYFRREISVLK